MQRISFMLWILMLACDSHEANKGWILNGPEFHCDMRCRDDLYAPSMGIYTTGCIKNDILSLSRMKTLEISMCLREKNGLKELTTTGIPRADYRITCRPAGDRMGWYRGWQSLTFNGKKCIRWDEAPVRFPLESFSNASSPSVDYTTLKLFSTTLSQHENYCRNPDNNRFGPWCFYREENKTQRAPCFHTCVTDIKKLCLAKAFFPYYQTPYQLDGAPVAPVDPHYLRNIKDEKLKQQNARNDLSDILDVADVINSVEHATPLYSITLTTRHLTHARLLGNAVVTRKKCHQTGLRTLIAGPWTPIKDDSLTLPEDSSDDLRQYSAEYRDYQRIRFLAGRQGVEKPWKPCFTACEDNTIMCWPSQTSLKLNKRLFYFGQKITNREQRLCLKWTEAMEDPAVLLQVFYYEQLTTRRVVKKKPLLNRFLDGGVRLLHSPICLDLARLIERSKKTPPTSEGIYKELFDQAYAMMFDEGPGCFTWTDESKKYVEYSPCFRSCPCGTSAMHAPFKPYREMCKNEKKNEYEPCTARRDVRVLHIREHGDKVLPLPDVKLDEAYIPLYLVIASAILYAYTSLTDHQALPKS